MDDGGRWVYVCKWVMVVVIIINAVCLHHLHNIVPGWWVRLLPRWLLQATTVIKTCEPVWSVRECRTPRDWSILALQNTRTGKAHYLVICKCPQASKLGENIITYILFPSRYFVKNEKRKHVAASHIYIVIKLILASKQTSCSFVFLIPSPTPSVRGFSSLCVTLYFLNQ